MLSITCLGLLEVLQDILCHLWTALGKNHQRSTLVTRALLLQAQERQEVGVLPVLSQPSRAC